MTEREIKWTSKLTQTELQILKIEWAGYFEVVPLKWKRVMAGDYRASIDGVEVYRLTCVESYSRYMRGPCWTFTRRVSGLCNWGNPSAPYHSKREAIASFEAGEYQG